MTVEIIYQPQSGVYKEIVYEVEGTSFSDSWTWIKFTDDEGNETVGQFRGKTIAVQYSESRKEIVVLTSDHVFRLDSYLNLLETDSQFEYKDVIQSPDGTFIFHDGDEIKKLDDSLTSMTILESPFEMHFIEFKKWSEFILEFTCDNVDNNYKEETLILDAQQWKILPKE